MPRLLGLPSAAARYVTLGAALALVAACTEATAPVGTPADVSVTFYVDRDGSGTFTPADSGLGGLTVGLTATQGPTFARGAVTTAAGIATFVDVPPGVYRLVLPSTPAGAVLTTASDVTVRVDAIGSVAASDVRYAWRPSTIAGRIYRDDDASGDYSTDDAVGAGLQVRLLAAPATVLDSTLADAEGAYAFNALAPGDYTVEFEQPVTIAYADGASRDVTLAAGQTETVDAVFTGSLLIPIADIRARPSGTLVATRAQITVAPGRFTSGSGGVNSEVWIQDATGGLAVFSVPTADSLVYAVGDTVEVAGTRGAFSGQIQIGTVTRFDRIAAGTPITPLTLSVTQALTGAEDGQLVRVNNLEVVSVGGGTSPAFNVTTSDAAGNTLTVRVAGALTGLTRASFVVGERYNVVGVLTNFFGTPQIKIREAADLTPGTPITAIADVRSSGVNGTIYAVRGVLTVAPAAIVSGSTSELWVQDATGGIAVFGVPTADSLLWAVGDSVEVTGTRGAFGSQLQLTSSPTVIRIGSGTAIVPAVQTGPEIVARTLEGQLIRLNNWTVTTIGGGTGPSFTVTGTADGETVAVRVSSALTGISRATFTVGSTYSVVGVLSQFNGTAQIKVRTPNDLIP